MYNAIVEASRKLYYGKTTTISNHVRKKPGRQRVTSENDSERIIEVRLEELYPSENHPFQVNDDESMQKLVRSIKQYGVREPGLARPRIDGGYELLAGNRRKRACELAGISTLPVIIREMNDDEAAIAMVDSNLERREKLLFSEKSCAYRVKLEALNHRGAKSDSPRQLSVDILCEQTGESKNQIFRIVRLTELIVDLIDKVDEGKLAFNPAVELSYLSIL
jgi:ParB family chromosome partitioning protein